MTAEPAAAGDPQAAARAAVEAKLAAMKDAAEADAATSIKDKM